MTASPLTSEAESDCNATTAIEPALSTRTPEKQTKTEAEFAEGSWYFAYGSNLSLARMKTRTQRDHKSRVVRLPGYRLAFNKRSQSGSLRANIVPAKRSEVRGVVYRCDDDAMAKLDIDEGVAGGHYERHTVRVFDGEGKAVDAVAYIAGAAHTVAEGRPDDEYLSHIRQGCIDHGLPTDWIESIASERPTPVATKQSAAAVSLDPKPSRSRQINAKREDVVTTRSAPPIDQTDRNDVMAAIRDVFGDGENRDRGTLIRDLARYLGYERVGSRIEETLDNDIRTAVRRDILVNDGSTLQLATRSIDDYSREQLVKFMMAEMSGWWEQDELVRQSARYLGFRRAGSKIVTAFKSAINSAIRQGLLERSGTTLRKQ